jgi:Tol biopolymer transport system component
VTPAGVESAAFPEERAFLMPAVSPDGSAVAVTIEGTHQDLWRFETARPVLRRLTSSPGEDFGPVWSRDGHRLAYTSVRQGQQPAVYVKPADTLDGETPVAEASGSFPNAWSADGRSIIATSESRDAGRRGAQLTLLGIGGAAGRPLDASPYGRWGAALSPDERRVAFVSVESGRDEVFVAVWPEGREPRQVSLNGGTSPVWSRDGRRLFYRSGDGLLAAEFGPGATPATPRLVLRGRFAEPARPDWPRNYDVAPDGRFLMIRETHAPTSREFVVVSGWRGQPLVAGSPP